MSRLFFSMLQRLAIVACTFFVPLMPFYVWQNLLRAQRSTEPIQFLKLFITYSTKIRILIVCYVFLYSHEATIHGLKRWPSPIKSTKAYMKSRDCED